MESCDRVNARLDGESTQRLRDLLDRTGHSVSHVVREALAVYHAQVIGPARSPARLLALAGEFRSGRSDLSTGVKLHVAEALAVKFPPRPGSRQLRQP